MSVQPPEAPPPGQMLASPPTAKALESGIQHIEHRLLTDVALATRLNRSDRPAQRGGGRGSRWRVGQFLAQREKQRAVERPGGAAHLRHQLHPDRFEQLGQAHDGKRIHILQHRLEAALHVCAMIAVANGGVERGQLVCPLDHAARDRADQTPFAFRIKRNAFILSAGGSSLNPWALAERRTRLTARSGTWRRVRPPPSTARRRQRR